MTDEKLLTNGQRKKLRKFLFLFVTSADQAEFEYDDGASTVPKDLRRQWAIEIERTKVELLIQRMRDRISFSYWLQWLFPLICVICAAIDPERLTEYLLLGFGGAGATNVTRKIDKHFVRKAAQAAVTVAVSPKANDVIPEELDASGDEPDSGPQLLPRETKPSKEPTT